MLRSKKKDISAEEQKLLRKAQKSLRKFRISTDIFANAIDTIKDKEDLKTIRLDVFVTDTARGLDPWMFAWCHKSKMFNSNDFEPQLVEMRIALECQHLIYYRDKYAQPLDAPVVKYKDQILIRYSDIQNIHNKSGIVHEFIRYRMKREIGFLQHLESIKP